MKLLLLSGRVLFSIIFLMAGFNHFSANSIGYAAAQGVPAPSFFVPASGILALTGAISIVLGYKAKLGAWLIVLFLVPVTLIMHNFWAVTYPAMKQIQIAMFLKNVSMLGGALIIAFFGAGPLSFDASKVASS